MKPPPTLGVSEGTQTKNLISFEEIHKFSLRKQYHAWKIKERLQVTNKVTWAYGRKRRICAKVTRGFACPERVWKVGFLSKNCARLCKHLAFSCFRLLFLCVCVFFWFWNRNLWSVCLLLKSAGITVYDLMPNFWVYKEHLKGTRNP